MPPKPVSAKYVLCFHGNIMTYVFMNLGLSYFEEGLPTYANLFIASALACPCLPITPDHIPGTAMD
jgi:hypothetical protein